MERLAEERKHLEASLSGTTAQEADHLFLQRSFWEIDNNLCAYWFRSANG